MQFYKKDKVNPIILISPNVTQISVTFLYSIDYYLFFGKIYTYRVQNIKNRGLKNEEENIVFYIFRFINFKWL